jgi:hypothetical protein
MIGLRTLAFTKQMVRVFNFVKLEEPDHLVTNAWQSIPRSSNRGLITSRSEDKQTQANKHIYTNKNITPYKIKHYQNEQYKNIEHFYGCAGIKNVTVEATVEKVIAFMLNKY